jgi:hypothetical protein
MSLKKYAIAEKGYVKNTYEALGPNDFTIHKEVLYSLYEFINHPSKGMTVPELAPYISEMVKTNSTFVRLSKNKWYDEWYAFHPSDIEELAKKYIKIYPELFVI